MVAIVVVVDWVTKKMVYLYSETTPNKLYPDILSKGALGLQLAQAGFRD